MNLISHKRSISKTALPGRSILAVALFLGMHSAFFAAEDGADARREFYVAPNGSDNADGSAAMPFKTIARARDAVRTVPANFDGDIVVSIANGTYELADTLTFDAEDGGRGEHKVIYQAEPHANVLISGGSPVTGWRKAGNGMWKAPLDRNVKLRNLYVNGRPAAMTSIEARGSGWGQYVIKAGQAPWAFSSGTQSDGVKYERGVPLIIRNPEDVEITSFQTWNTATVCVREIVKENNSVILKLQEPYGAIAQTCHWANFSTGGRHRVSNAFEFLAKPGQFYFDRAAKTVYYIPRDGEEMASATAVAPRLIHLLSITGSSPTRRVRNIEFRGLHFAYSDWNLAEIDGSHGKACVQGASYTNAYSKTENWHSDIYRNTDVAPGAIELDHCENIRFERNRLEHLAVEGIALPNDDQNIRIVGNVFRDTGGGAVLVGHTQHAYEGDGPELVHMKNGVQDGAGPEKEKYPKEQKRVCHGAVVANNLIRDTSRDFWGHAAITGFFVEGMRIEHNDITNTPFNGVSLGWGWWNLNGDSQSVLPGHPTTTAGNNRVSFNRFHKVMQKLHDSGSIYTLGSQPGSVVEGNYTEGVGDPADATQDLRYGNHADEGSAYIKWNDSVFDILPTVSTLNGFAYGKAHDVPSDTIYTTSLKCSTGGGIKNMHYCANNIWPLGAFTIVQRAGLEPAFDDLFSNDGPSLAERILPVSAMVGPGESLPIPPLAGAKGWVALAKETQKPVDGISGAATAIAAPKEEGVYYLFANDGSGNVSKSSARIIVRTSPPVIKGIENGATYTTPVRPVWEGLAWPESQPKPLEKPLENGALIARNGHYTLTARLANGLENTVSFTLNIPRTSNETTPAPGGPK